MRRKARPDLNAYGIDEEDQAELLRKVEHIGAENQPEFVSKVSDKMPPNSTPPIPNPTPRILCCQSIVQQQRPANTLTVNAISLMIHFLHNLGYAKDSLRGEGRCMGDGSKAPAGAGL